MRIFRGKSRSRRGHETSASESAVGAPVPGQRGKIRQAIDGPRIQAKTEISSPGDASEREADEVAERVLRMPDGAAGAHPSQASPPSIQRACAACETDAQDEERISRKAEGPADSSAAPAGVTALGGGRPLPTSTRAFFEPRFGHDFGNVRVHTDASAAKAARSIRAQAFTYREHIAFATGRFAPETASGRKLLAHELTHVVQQGGKDSGEIRRTPSDPPTLTPPLPSPSPVPTPGPSAVPVPPAPAPMGPDARENLMQAARFVMFHAPGKVVDHAKNTAAQNEDATRENVFLAFGDEAGVNAVFDTLSPAVRDDVDADSARDFKRADVAAGKAGADKPDALSMRTRNRIQFFMRMRLYFPSWAALIDHFKGIERVSDGPVDLFLHKSAAARFRRAISILKAKGKTLPTVHGGFQLRGLYRGDFAHPGYMVHALGYAFDIMAKANPKISMESKNAQGPERNVQTLLAATVGEKNTRMSLDLPKAGSGTRAHPMNVGEQWDFISNMGKRTAGDLTAAKDDTDPAAVEYFRNFDREFAQMASGSTAFRNSLSATHRAALLTLRNSYFDELKVLRDERKKGSRADAGVIAAHEAARRQLLARIPSLVTEWLTAIDTSVQAEFAAHPGMDRMRSPSVIGQDISANRDGLKAAEADARKTADAVERARSGRAAAKSVLERARQRLAEARRQGTQPKSCAPSRGGDWDVRSPCQDAPNPLAGAQKAYDDALRAWEEKSQALTDAVLASGKAGAAVTKAGKTRDALADELRQSDKPELKGAWRWLDQLRELRQALAAPDLTTDSGVRAYERFTTGDLSELGSDSVADNPPLLRLLDIGFFNPTPEFDVDFFEEMAHSGFQPGASWQFGGVDAMHFELTEAARFTILSPGILPPK